MTCSIYNRSDVEVICLNDSFWYAAIVTPNRTVNFDLHVNAARILFLHNHVTC